MPAITVGRRPAGAWSLSLSHAVSDSANGDDEARLGGVVTELAPQMSDVHVDEVIVADPRFVADCFEELAATQHDAGTSGQGFKKIELGARQQNWLIVDEYLSCGHLDTQRAKARRRHRSTGAAPCASRGRRSTRTGATRGENGLVT